MLYFKNAHSKVKVVQFKYVPKLDSEKVTSTCKSWILMVWRFCLGQIQYCTIVWW